jgi:transposase
MPRNYGYASKGKRCYGTHDWGAKGRTNAIGALLDKTLLTVGLFECNIDTRTFTAWIKQELLSILPPKSIIVMDNASFHKGKMIKEYIEMNGHTLEYLPAYSPDLNPIERKWSQAKILRRKYCCNIDQLFSSYNL